MRAYPGYNPYYTQPEKINPYSKLYLGPAPVHQGSTHRLVSWDRSAYVRVSLPPVLSQNQTIFSANAQGATRLSEMQAYELWKLEQDAKLIIKEMDRMESESSKSDNNS